MDQLAVLFETAKKAYDLGKDPLGLVQDVTLRSLRLLATAHAYALPKQSIAGKCYWVFQNAEGTLSRPYLPSMFMSKERQFIAAWAQVQEKIDSRANLILLPESDVNSVVYTAIMSFSMCYDLWKSGSRKTPGTAFEVMLAGFLRRLLPAFRPSKHVPLLAELEHEEGASMI